MQEVEFQGGPFDAQKLNVEEGRAPSTLPVGVTPASVDGQPSKETWVGKYIFDSNKNMYVFEGVWKK